MVKDRNGADVYGYPVTDFCDQGTALVTDAKGLLVFHHTVTALMEFGGECRHLFFLFAMEKCRPPAFFCEFRQGGRMIHRVDYRELDLGARSLSEGEPNEWVTVDLHGCDRRAAKEKEEGMTPSWTSREYPVIRRTIRVHGAD